MSNINIAMDTTHHIAVVDDEPDIRETVQEYLELKGFRVSTAADGLELRRLVAEQPVDLVVLDITMPGEDGLSLARFLREKTDTYIVMLTSAGNVVDRIIGLEVGADDYLPKPVILRELHARIKAVLRYEEPVAQAVKQYTAAGSNIWFGSCRLHLASQKLYDGRGEEIPLSAREFQLLQAFTECPNQPLSRDQIFNLTHNRDWHPCDRSLDLRISRLRRKIEPDAANPRIIKTVHGVGYVFARE
jgi:two-component system phosphate regulon response regulator OmpR